MTRKIALAVTLVTLIGGACGGEDDVAERATTVHERGDASDVTGERFDEREPEGVLDVQAALLTLGDMPTGWTTSPQQDEADEGSESFCTELDVIRNDLEHAAEAEAAFQGGENGPFAWHFVGIFSENEAENVFSNLREAIETCADTEVTNEDGSTFRGGLAPISFPKFADETFAVRLQGTLQTPPDDEGFGDLEFPMTGDIVYVRDGDAITSIFHFAVNAGIFGGGDVDSQITEDLVRKADAKLNAASS